MTTELINYTVITILQYFGGIPEIANALHPVLG